MGFSDEATARSAAGLNADCAAGESLAGESLGGESLGGESLGGVGGDLRAVRRSKGLSLADVADQIGRSIGFLSQIERGLSQPSLEDLSRLSALYGVPRSLFFGEAAADPDERGLIVRAARRRRLGHAEAGLVEELLSPDLGGAFELIHSVFSPGAGLQEPARRDTEEAGFLISGVLELELRGAWRRIEPGDSFRFKNEPFRWRNPGAEPAVALWVVSPPIY